MSEVSRYDTDEFRRQASENGKLNCTWATWRGGHEKRDAKFVKVLLSTQLQKIREMHS